MIPFMIWLIEILTDQCVQIYIYYVGKRLIDRRKTNQLGSDLCECCEQVKWWIMREKEKEKDRGSY